MERVEHPITEGNRPILEDIIQKIYDRKDATEFRHPVDYETFGRSIFPILLKARNATIQANLKASAPLEGLVGGLLYRPEDRSGTGFVGVIWGLTDYPKIIKKMMDLSTVKQNLEAELYKNVEDVLDDLQLIWDNCKLYNVEFSNIYKMAMRLEDLQVDLVKNYLPQVESYGKNNESYRALERTNALNLKRVDATVEE